MGLFRRRPGVVEAERFDPDSAVLPFRAQGVCCYSTEEGWHLHTLEGPLHLSSGDWVIKGVKGEFYPCKPDIFAALYEPTDG